jgi:hypothetical protein
MIEADIPVQMVADLIREQTKAQTPPAAAKKPTTRRPATRRRRR